jgi:hypothetical protein
LFRKIGSRQASKALSQLDLFANEYELISMLELRVSAGK